MRGYFAIGIENTKTEINVGSLWRSANAFGAAFIFTIGARYRRQAADTPNAPLSVPLYNFASWEDVTLPENCPLVGVEILPEARSLERYTHPERAAYLLGAEDHGLSPEAVKRCNDRFISIPSARCLNVATAGSIVMYDRIAKAKSK